MREKTGGGFARSRWNAIVVLILCLSCGASGAGAVVDVVLRYDDYAWDGPTLADTRVLDAVLREGVKITFAVIPNKGRKPFSPEAVRALAPALTAGILEVAQHGYTHDVISTTGQLKSEFVGRPRREQRSIIGEGKRILEDTFRRPITVFIPPWNSMDGATIECLEDLDFKVASDNWAFNLGRSSNLEFLPATCTLPDLRMAIERGKTDRKSSGAVVCLFHGYDFKEIDPERGWLSFSEFDQLMGWVAKQNEVRTLTISEAVSRQMGISGPQKAATAVWLSRDALLPGFLRVSSSRSFNLPNATELAQLTYSTNLRLTGVALIFAVIVGGLFLSGCRMTGGRLGVRILPCIAAILVIATLVVGLGLGRGMEGLSYRRLIAVETASGIALGVVLWLGIFGRRFLKSTSEKR